MASATSLVLGIVHILFLIGRTEGVFCASGQIRCRSRNQCVSLGDVCRSGSQCADGSDEDTQICSVWISDSRCSHGEYYCAKPPYYGRCLSHAEFCTSCPEEDIGMCDLLANNILKLDEEETEETGLSLTKELVSLMQKAVNATTNVSTSCPMFYSPVGDACLSFFTPAKVPWPEARQFCLSIGGDLAAIKGFVDHDKLLGYMQKAHLTTDFWIGGRFDVDTNSWSWVLDDTPLPLGAPFWAARCAAMTYEHYYYYTDEECQENRSPLCLFTGRPRQEQVDTSLTD
ncbi:uncharacterized protein LOC135195414 isoform X2 [Macrobrachium nipponense]|uniref:uncharacterized protein LOC135195414 isoform X2 n=1 Tax=Macrobrachium nipponense TaxID=159736 RepID=UPI0030C83791